MSISLDLLFSSDFSLLFSRLILTDPRFQHSRTNISKTMENQESKNKDSKSRQIWWFQRIAQYEKIRIKLPLFKLCERSELVNISQFFCSFLQTRHLTVELSRLKPKLGWKTLKMTRQFRRKKRSKTGNIFGVISHCVVTVFLECFVVKCLMDPLKASRSFL